MLVLWDDSSKLISTGTDCGIGTELSGVSLALRGKGSVSRAENGRPKSELASEFSHRQLRMAFVNG